MLDPELERIARKVRAQPLVRTSSSKNASRAASEAGGPDDVAVKVSWLVHPLAGGPPPQTWSFKIRRVRCTVSSRWKMWLTLATG